MSSGVELKNKGLKQLIKAFKTMPEIRVGILGGKAMREDVGPSNAAIGAAHEYGTKRLPQRSFLRVPLTENLDNFLERSGAFDRQTLDEVIRNGTIRPWCVKVAITAEAVVAEAFATGGFGKWTPSDMRNKQVHQTLVETQQLRNSITSEVKG